LPGQATGIFPSGFSTEQATRPDEKMANIGQRYGEVSGTRRTRLGEPGRRSQVTERDYQLKRDQWSGEGGKRDFGARAPHATRSGAAPQISCSNNPNLPAFPPSCCLVLERSTRPRVVAVASAIWAAGWQPLCVKGERVRRSGSRCRGFERRGLGRNGTMGAASWGSCR
jgi:hypothetical protein